jgi:flagellar biosynthetic protein FliP
MEFLSVAIMNRRFAIGIALLFHLSLALAQTSGGGLPAITSTPAAGGGTTYSLTIQTLLLMTALSFIPAIVLMMTGFTRIVIVLSLLRHAMGMQTAPQIRSSSGCLCFSPFS